MLKISRFLGIFNKSENVTATRSYSFMATTGWARYQLLNTHPHVWLPAPQGALPVSLHCCLPFCFWTSGWQNWLHIRITWGTLWPWLHPPQRFDGIGLAWGSFSSTSGDANIRPRLRNHGPGGIESGHRSPSHEVPGEPLLALVMFIKEMFFLVLPRRIDLIFSCFLILWWGLGVVRFTVWCCWQGMDQGSRLLSSHRCWDSRSGFSHLTEHVVWRAVACSPIISSSLWRRDGGCFSGVCYEINLFNAHKKTGCQFKASSVTSVFNLAVIYELL